MKKFLIRTTTLIVFVVSFCNTSRASQVQLFDNSNSITLDKNRSFEKQVTRTNTVYIIKDDFTLNKDVVIPDKSVLLFEGGTLNGNAKITFRNTEIKGTYNAFNSSLSFAGTIIGNVDLFYFDIRLDDKSRDNGPVINKVAAVFKNLFIPAGNIFFTTPIVMSSMNRIECDANLLYYGHATNVSAITIKKSDGTFIFNGIIRNESHSGKYPVYTKTNNSKLRGLEISSVNNSLISFKNISYFNEGLRISDTSHTGCSYNTFMLGVIINSNYHVRVYQHNMDNKPSASALSWCNQNLFMGGRCTNFSHDWNYKRDVPCYCFYFKGGEDDGFNDMQNSVNNITI